MPRGDGTGPTGLGPMTGRSAGFCAGYNAPGYMNPVYGGGSFGRGRGFRNRYYATGLYGWQRASMSMPYGPEVTPKQEADILKNEADVLKGQLEDIQQRIESLEKAQSGKE